MVKIDRIAAWVLFATLIAYAITGYGMTRGFIPRDLASELHLGWLGIIGLAAFITHTSWAIRLFFMRHRIWNRATKILLPLFYILLAVLFIWLHFFFNAQTQNDTGRGVPTYTSSPNTSSSTNMTFNAQTLAKYDGLNGQPAYVAVDGVVYDMSQTFRNGKHHGFSAGQDLSQAFHREHPADYLNGLTVVGTYTK